jgi:hypothetical protein
MMDVVIYAIFENGQHIRTEATKANHWDGVTTLWRGDTYIGQIVCSGWIEITDPERIAKLDNPVIYSHPLPTNWDEWTKNRPQDIGDDLNAPVPTS